MEKIDNGYFLQHNVKDYLLDALELVNNDKLNLEYWIEYVGNQNVLKNYYCQRLHAKVNKLITILNIPEYYYIGFRLFKPNKGRLTAEAFIWYKDDVEDLRYVFVPVDKSVNGMLEKSFLYIFKNDMLYKSYSAINFTELKHILNLEYNNKTRKTAKRAYKNKKEKKSIGVISKKDNLTK